ncbi:MAG: hypothetical protein AB1500_02045 [Bacillota bacterium]
MIQTLSPAETELYRRVDEVLHYLWDPLGVSEIPPVRDEYYSHLSNVYNLVQNTVDGKDIVDYLLFIECESMGIKISDRSRDRASEIAQILIEYRELLKEKPAR